jgi:hypothetical protein
MATALYGAPVGFIAQEEQANKTALLQLQAEETMGKLAEIPADIRLKNAQAANLEGQAAARGAESADLAAMDRYERELRAKRVSQQVAATQGRDATVQDLEATDPARVSDPMLELYNHMVESGAPSRMTAPLAEKIAKIQENESTAAYRKGQARVQQLEAESRLADQIGTMAQTALASPEGYAQMRLLATQQGAKLPPGIKKIIDGLPQDWNAAKRILTPLALNALSVKDQKELALKEEKNKQDIATGKASEARARASAGLAGVRATLVKEQTTNLKKLGGEGTPAEVAAKETSLAMNHTKLEAERLKMHPRLPADSSKITPGRTYTVADGRVARAVTTADGKVAFEVILPALPKMPVPRTVEQIEKDQRRRLRMNSDRGGADEGDD